MARDIRILVIGNANLVRDGLWALLRAQEGMEVLTAIESGVEAINSAVVNLIPDVAVMHFPIVTPGALDAVAAVRRRWPTGRVIALTPRLDHRVVSTVKEAGIDGCIAESNTRMELLSAIRTVANGERYLTPSIPRQEISGPDTLTEREKEVTRLIGAGHRTREIARRLSLSDKTIEKHRASIMRKLGLRSAAAVAAYAITHGYLIL
jgi:DNA-binding NarL/FixJ family response regulator